MIQCCMHTTDRAKERPHYFNTTWATYRKLICFKDFCCCLHLFVHICKTLWLFRETICTSLQWNVSLSVSKGFLVSCSGSVSCWDLPKGSLFRELFCVKTVFELNFYLIIFWFVHMHMLIYVSLVSSLFLLFCMMVSDNKGGLFTLLSLSVF